MHMLTPKVKLTFRATGLPIIGAGAPCHGIVAWCVSTMHRKGRRVVLYPLFLPSFLPSIPMSTDYKDSKLENEKNVDYIETAEATDISLKLDKHGVPLSPQPTDDPEDPRNVSLSVSKRMKDAFILVQVSVLSALGYYNTASINPAYSQLSQEFGVSIVTASYQTTVSIALNGIGPFLFIPFAHVYGRRPIGVLSALGCGYAHNFGQLIGLRVLNGIFPVGLHWESQQQMISFTFTNVDERLAYSPFFRPQEHILRLSPKPEREAHNADGTGGLIGQFLGWRWVFKFAAILNSFCLIFTFFFLPETLYIRDSKVASKDPSFIGNSPVQTISYFRQYLSRMRLWRRFPGRQMRIRDFFLPYFRMIRYPSVIFPAIYYAAQYGLGSTLPAVTVSHIFAQEFGWDTLQIGLAYGLALLVGALAGETVGGWVVDGLMNRARRRAGPDAPSEIRLKAIWTGEIIVPYKAPWIVPILGMGVACFGVQCITTVIYTYLSDCHTSKSAEVGQVLNFVRQEIGMTFAFYAIVLGQAIGGYHLLFVFFVCMGSILAFIPILVLMWKGEEIRAAEERAFK
ncbi:hypothetical protein D9757_006047 [Collybiopsis confluens]|uniref:Major facilitator superfamily (MFS) profile domain-containing protein n=1 Tax=Collybiopsis confluens TaxID=2823264 RepID=A0A8H5HUC4_9AGAR|nr:hypothetical protein D9757_006047 [Collybiopsis confluens]